MAFDATYFFLSRKGLLTMRIAYIGPARGTSLHRARALERLGHTVTIIDPWQWLGRSKWVGPWLHSVGGLGVGLYINRHLFAEVTAARSELIFVAQSEFLGPKLLRRLHSLNTPIANYTNDNPFNSNSSRRFRYYRKALPWYDLLVFPREENIPQAQSLGARNVMRVWFTADEKAHRPRSITTVADEGYAAEVSFIGTWIPERGPFMAELIRRGVPLSIWGDRWQKASEWPLIAPHWRGKGIYNDEGYADVILSSKICLGLVSKDHRDLHTTRSIEIPALGSLLCAERTTEHIALYQEDREAIFWRDAEECAAQCLRILQDEPLRRSLARQGHERAMRNNHFNEPMLTKVIERVQESLAAKQ